MKNKKSTQSLFGLKGFGRYGLKTEKGELSFFKMCIRDRRVCYQRTFSARRIYFKR